MPSRKTVRNGLRVRLLAWGSGLLTGAGLLLFGPLHRSLSVFAALLVILHLALGLLLLVPGAFALRGLWRQTLLRGTAGRTFCRRLFPVLAFTMLACAITGVWLFGRAASGNSVTPERFAWTTHLATGFVVVLLALFWKIADLTGNVSAAALDSDKFFRLSRKSARVAALMLFGAILLAIAVLLWPSTVQPDTGGYDGEAYYRDLTATNARQAQNPLFPANVRLPDGMSAAESDSRRNTQSAAYCGRSGCHVQDYREWLPSAHHFGGADPFYLRTAANYAAINGPDAVRWCAGCHNPVSSAEEQTAKSRFSTQEDPQGKAQSVLSTHHSSLITSRGVDCVACHAVAGTENRVGNGSYTLGVPPSPPFAASETGWRRRLHDFLLRVRPYPHVQSFARNLYQKPEFCATCHRQSFSVAQNHYRFVAGPDTFGEWQNGPQSGRVARAEMGQGEMEAGNIAPQTCQSCHMARTVGGHVVHGSPGANTLLPALRGDPAYQAQVETVLKASRVTLALFLSRRQPNAAAFGLPIALDKADPPPVLRPGEEVTLNAVVSNPGVGHAFPSGYDDIRDAWLELTVADARGRVLLQNGRLADPQQSLPDDVHAYTSVGLDRSGAAITRHNLTDQVTTAYRRTLRAGGSDVARYRFRVPAATSSGAPLALPLTVRARLLYRPLRPNFARQSVPASDAFLAVTQIVSAECRALSAEETAARPSLSTKASPKQKAQSVLSTQRSALGTPLKHWLDYGQALLAPDESPDFAGAVQAFERARQVAPDAPEPLWRLGQAYLREPSLSEARSRLEAANHLAPTHPGIRADLGLTALRQGQYDRALQFQQPLAREFPLDTTLQYELGTTLKRMGRFREAAEAFQQSLAADPNNAPAHFSLQQCLYVLRRYPEARREEAISRYLGEDVLRPRLLPTYLRDHPSHAAAIQPFPVHHLTPEQKGK